jgi:hypothetical protein
MMVLFGIVLNAAILLALFVIPVLDSFKRNAA